MHTLFKKYIIRNLGLYIDYIYSFNNASYEPRHEKSCLRGLRPGRRHKTGCTGETEASWRLQFVLRRELVPFVSHWHNKRIKTAIYMECKVYKKTKTFRGSGTSLPPYQFVLKAGGKTFFSNLRYNTNLYCITEQAEWQSAVVERTSGKLEGLGSILSLGIQYYKLHFFIFYLLLFLSRTKLQ